jgi:hypothetical protein
MMYIYTYLKHSVSISYEYIIMILLLVISVLQKHSNYYLAIAGTLRCPLMSTPQQKSMNTSRKFRISATGLNTAIGSVQ